MKNFSLIIASLVILMAPSAYAQEENGVSTEIEFGAIFTTGNAEDESVNFKGTVDWVRDRWDYMFSVDAFRSSRQDTLSAQRLYYVASAGYDLSEVSFVETRLAHEDDRFSGYDSQTDLTVSYGRELLTNRDDMGFSYTAGIGARQSKSPAGDFDEAIVRIAGNYDWNISDTAVFNQTIAADSGDETSIFRAESSIETKILDNLSLRFAFTLKHQTEVPIGREKTDTATTVTLVMNF